MKITQYYINATSIYDGTTHTFGLYYDTKVKSSNEDRVKQYFDNIEDGEKVMTYVRANPDEFSGFEEIIFKQEVYDPETDETDEDILDYVDINELRNHNE